MGNSPGQAGPTGFLHCLLVDFLGFPILITAGLQGELYGEKPLVLSRVQLLSLSVSLKTNRFSLKSTYLSELNRFSWGQ